MTASAFASLASPSWLLFWEWTEFLSIIVVGVGCWGEVWAEHHRFKSQLNDLMPTSRINKKWERFFWRMVVGGLCVELFAFGFSFIASNVEIEQLKASNNLALSKTPGRMPVFNATAFVTLHIATNAISTNTWGGTWPAMLNFHGSNTLGPYIRMVASEAPLWWGPQSNLTLSLPFACKSGDGAFDVSTREEAADDFLDEMTEFIIQPAFLYKHTRILDGHVTLVLNGSVAKTFTIPSQNWGLDDNETLNIYGNRLRLPPSSSK